MAEADDARSLAMMAGYEIRVASAADGPAIRRFNERLRAHGISYQLPLNASLAGEVRAPTSGFAVFRETIVALQHGEVRAGLLLYHDSIRIGGVEQPFCWLQLPISEGLVDSRHGLAFIVLLSTVIEREPLLLSLGVGSLEEKFARVLLELGWRYAPVPFVVRLHRVSRVLGGLDYLRRRGGRLATAARVARMTGLAYAASGLLEVLRWVDGLRLRHVTVSTELEFGGWADVVDASARAQYGAAVARSALALNIRYPRLDERYVRLRVRRTDDGEDLGWIVVTNVQMRQNPYFGDLHVGALVDGYGRLEHVPTLVAAGLRELSRRRVDLVVANWSHAAWVTACRNAAFLVGPSNYFFFAPSATPLLSPEGCPLEQAHVTRGDCDGPGQLLPRRPTIRGQ